MSREQQMALGWFDESGKLNDRFKSTEDAPMPLALPNTGGAEPSAISCQPSAISCQLSAVGEAEWQAASVFGALTLSITFGAGYAVGRRRLLRH